MQHERGADHLLALEPADRLGAPLLLHVGPGRRLEEARRGLGPPPGEVLGCGDVPSGDGRVHAGSRYPSATGLPTRLARRTAYAICAAPGTTGTTGTTGTYAVSLRPSPWCAGRGV